MQPGELRRPLGRRSFVGQRRRRELGEAAQLLLERGLGLCDLDIVH